MIFKREPALWLNLLATLIAWLSTWFLHLTPEQQSVLNGVAYAVMGVIIAAMTGDGLSAGILGLFKAIISLGLGFGLHLSDDMQTTVLSLVAAVTTMFIRTQVVAPAPPTPPATTRTP
jgi:hypothetical protein